MSDESAVGPDTRAETVYKWTVRGLYLAAFALNAWYMLEVYRDTPEAKRIISRVEKWAHPFVAKRDAMRRWRRDRTAMLLEAWHTVEGKVESNPADEEN